VNNNVTGPESMIGMLVDKRRIKPMENGRHSDLVLIIAVNFDVKSFVDDNEVITQVQHVC